VLAAWTVDRQLHAQSRRYQVMEADSYASDGPAGRRPERAFVTGSFNLYFRQERAARAASRNVRGAGFVVEIREKGGAPWSIVARRREPFPADEQRRYTPRLCGLANAHGGDCARFVPDSLPASPDTAAIDAQTV